MNVNVNAVFSDKIIFLNNFYIKFIKHFKLLLNIKNFDEIKLKGREIITGQHCFGCTAGSGSSCGGTTA